MKDPRDLVLALEQPLGASDHRSEAELKAIVMAGLTFPSDYWVGLAVDWLVEGAPMDDDIGRELERVAVDRAFSQRTRHAAQKLVSHWKRHT